jgi:catechol 1,2-dioxygenase
MKRRSFIQKSSLLAFSMSAFGNISWNGKNFVGDTATTTDILGPFYRPGTPLRTDLVPAGSAAKVLLLNGTLFQKDGKKLLSDALIEIWQCDEKQVYDNTSDEYLFRGAMVTGKDGKYSFKTIVPVAYKATDIQWRPAHIHLRVSSPDHQDLISQIYFKGDPYLEQDTSSSSPQSKHRILETGINKNGEHEVTFNIRMQENFPLDPAMHSKIAGLYQMENGNAEFSFMDDLLFLKLNGQIVEGLAYKGNNTFEGGLGYVKARFEMLADGGSKVHVSIGAYDGRDPAHVRTEEGIKYLKY